MSQSVICTTSFGRTPCNVVKAAAGRSYADVCAKTLSDLVSKASSVDRTVLTFRSGAI